MKKATPKQKFKKIFNQLPEQARERLVLFPATYPMSLNVCWLEIKNDTDMGRLILEDLGF